MMYCTGTAARRAEDYCDRQGEWTFVCSTEGDGPPGLNQRPVSHMPIPFAEDLAEQHDIVAEEPATLDELKTLSEAWSAESEADRRRLGIGPEVPKAPVRPKSRTTSVR